MKNTINFKIEIIKITKLKIVLVQLPHITLIAIAFKTQPISTWGKAN